jgi:ubiquitin-conjugating enzyme E2 J2
LRKEYLRLQKEPVALIEAAPLENNILEWHYVIKGSPDSPFEGGYYHGKIKFPAEYPFKPPSIQMTTPSGRFKPDSRLCLTMSDFHPESWNPLWSVSSILTGLQSFMNENTPTVGSVETSDESKRAYARTSLAFNMQNPTFCKLFPHYVEVYQEQTKALSPAKPLVTEKSVLIS